MHLINLLQQKLILANIPDRSIDFKKTMKVVIIPLNEDNYGYLLIDESTNVGAIVDVSNQPDIVYETIKSHNIEIKAILTTHKHYDHAGGNNRMKELLPSIEVIGGKYDNVEGCTKFVDDGDIIYISDIKITCMLTPGHTMGHICYYAEHNDERAVFTGDCLFIGGCGKFFEGSGSDMFPSLITKLSNLPHDTLVYCGHEYTLSNYRFALSVDPTNEVLIEENVKAMELRSQGLYTVPSTISKELQTNPFLRVYDHTIISYCGECNDPIDTLTALRLAKNAFK